jgi:hypothetical protein
MSAEEHYQRENFAGSRSVPDLFGKLITDISDLFRKEIELFRSEMSDKISQLGDGLGLIAAGGVCLLVALVVLTGALVAALGALIGPGWAALIVGVVLAIAGGIFVRQGLSNLAPENLTPDRSTAQLRRDAQVIKENV